MQVRFFTGIEIAFIAWMLFGACRRLFRGFQAESAHLEPSSSDLVWEAFAFDIARAGVFRGQST